LIGRTIAFSATKGAKSARQGLPLYSQAAPLYAQVPLYKYACSLRLPCSYRSYHVSPSA
jgi:hypothetical protein